MKQMKELITKEHAHLLYKDEVNDDFLITNDCEIYVKSDSTLGITAFRNGSALKRILRDKLEAFSTTDDNLYLFDIKVENLPYLLGKCSTLKTRMGRGSKKLAKLEKRLGHKILNYRPRLGE